MLQLLQACSEVSANYHWNWFVFYLNFILFYFSISHLITNVLLGPSMQPVVISITFVAFEMEHVRPQTFKGTNGLGQGKGLQNFSTGPT